MAKMRRGLAAISSHKSSLTLDGLRRPAPMAISAKMLAILQKLEADDAEHLADLRESARQEAENNKKRRAAGRRPAWTPRQEAEHNDVRAAQRRTTPEERSKLVRRAARTRLANKKSPATEGSRAEGSMHAVAQSAQKPGGDTARGELFAGLVRAARRVVAQKAKKTKKTKKTKAARRRAATPSGK